jgi:hypothetical protein
MKYFKIITAAFFIALYFTGNLYSKPLFYKDFVLGDSKKNITVVLSSQKYSKHLIYYDSNDRYINGIKIKSENSIKIIINQYMEKEEILLVFDTGNILFDIYIKKKPADIRDFIDHRINMIETYGKPADDQTANELNILAWTLEKKKYALYLIFDSANENLLINMRDVQLNLKYQPSNKE